MPTPTQKPEQTHLSIADAAAMLGCSTVHIRREIQRGNLKASRFGHRIFIARRDLERALKPVRAAVRSTATLGLLTVALAASVAPAPVLRVRGVGSMSLDAARAVAAMVRRHDRATPRAAGEAGNPRLREREVIAARDDRRRQLRTDLATYLGTPPGRALNAARQVDKALRAAGHDLI